MVKDCKTTYPLLKIVLTPSPTLLTGCPEDGWEGSWKQVVLGRLPAHPTQRLRRVVFDRCQSSGGREKGIAWAFRVVVRRCVLLASPKLCRTFQPPRCKRYFAASGAAVDVFSDAHLQPYGKKVHMSCCCSPSSHTQCAHMLQALVNVILSMNLRPFM